MPDSSPKSPMLTLALDRRSASPLQNQIFDQVREAILSGRLEAGTMLPSSRLLATEQGVSRNTVLGAFDRLMAEGYIEGRRGSGTRVSNVLPDDLITSRGQTNADDNSSGPAGKLSTLVTGMASRHYVNRHSGAGTRAFRPGLPDLENFPFQTWGRINTRFWRHPPRDLLYSGDLGGYLPLRKSIAAYLGAVRGIACSADQVMITSGAQQALDLIARAVIDPGDEVWVEDPGYAGLQATLKAAGAQIKSVPVDNEGLSVKSGRGLAPRAVLAAITPSHQFPSGVTMSLTRRLELLEWASESDAWILEDDYDSEFRYGGKPLSALQGLDDAGRVIYVGTFSKVLFPSLRLGYVVLPPAFVSPFRNLQGAINDYPALALQPTLHAFMEEGHFAAHIRRQRKLYAERQATLIEAINKHASGLMSASPHEAGMHLIAGLRRSCRLTDQEFSARAAAHNLTVPALSSYFAGKKNVQGLVLGYAGLTTQEINKGIMKLVRLVTETG